MPRYTRRQSVRYVGRGRGRRSAGRFRRAAYITRARALSVSTSAELKSFDVSPGTGFASAALPVPGSALYGGVGGPFAGIACLNMIVPGTTVYDRIGSKITMTSMAVGFTLTGTNSTASTVRGLLVYDRQVNGVGPLITDILSDNVSGGVTLHSSLNIANKNRFLILRDQYFVLDPSLIELVNAKMYCKARLSIEYLDGEDASIINITTGAVYLVLFQVGSAAPNVPTVSNITTRIRYID